MPSWTATTGRPDSRRRCREKLESLLASYQPTPLPHTVDRDVRRICADARKRLSAN